MSSTICLAQTCERGSRRLVDDEFGSYGELGYLCFGTQPPGGTHTVDDCLIDRSRVGEYARNFEHIIVSRDA